MATAMALPILTKELIERVRPHDPESATPPPPANRRPASDNDYAEMVRSVLASAPDRSNVHVFAYGSLIWSPCFRFEGEEIATAHGWHRAFRLGWDYWFRGSPDRAGLMMVLDRGGTCKGVSFKLPARSVEDELLALFRREVHFLPHAFPARWIRIVGSCAPNALTFAMDRYSGAYVPDLTENALVEVLSTAAGPRGTMAEYLYNTVAHLEERGIRDRRLWRLQGLVAERLSGAREANSMN
jgi:cation transport protein ChaC